MIILLYCIMYNIRTDTNPRTTKNIKLLNKITSLQFQFGFREKLMGEQRTDRNL